MGTDADGGLSSALKNPECSMTQLLSLSRAARLAGISRAEIQKRIRRGELTTFEGELAISDLLRVYPQVSLENDDALERVQQIKTHAVPKSHQGDTVLPSPEVLVSRLRALSAALTEKVSALEVAEDRLDQVTDQLAALSETAPEPVAARLRAILDGLADTRSQTPRPAGPDAQTQVLVKETFLRLLAAHVQLIPSGHEFFVEGTETILEASVRAGLQLAYGCSSGNCGACKARLVRGEARKVRDHDYVLSARERQMGYLLACSNTAVTDIVLEAAEALGVDDLPRQEIRAALHHQESLGHHLLHLRIQTPRTQTLRFMAGQSVRLCLEDGRSTELSIASCPCNGRDLHFLVRRKAGDAFREALFRDQIRLGELVIVEGPSGGFVLDENDPRPAVFLACGDGIAPIQSLIEHGVSIDRIESFHLYWAVDAPEDLHQARWCRAMTESLDHFRYTPLIGATPEDLLAMLGADQDPLSEHRFYLAGPGAILAPILQGLQARGVSPENLRHETVE